MAAIIITDTQPKESIRNDNMIDIHCHILPGVDDGAESLDEAKIMLDLQRKSGVKQLYLTPHFYPDEEDLDVFLSDRQKAWDELSADSDLQIRLGAEVAYGHELLSLDLRKLTLGQSEYLLLEFPMYYPAYVMQTVERLLKQGMIPILAHVERYLYFRRDPDLLKELIDLGALAQVTAQALFDKRDRNFAMACLRHNLAQIVASDAHNTTERKPCMELLHKLPEELMQRHKEYSAAVWENRLPGFVEATAVNDTYFGYR